MNVEVIDAPAGRAALVDPDRVAIRSEPVIERAACLNKERIRVGDFGWRQVEERDHMPLRHDLKVARRGREVVVAGEAGGVLGLKPVDRRVLPAAEQAVVTGGWFDASRRERTCTRRDHGEGALVAVLATFH